MQTKYANDLHVMCAVLLCDVSFHGYVKLHSQAGLEIIFLTHL